MANMNKSQVYFLRNDRKEKKKASKDNIKKQFRKTTLNNIREKKSSGLKKTPKKNKNKTNKGTKGKR